MAQVDGREAEGAQRPLAADHRRQAGATGGEVEGDAQRRDAGNVAVAVAEVNLRLRGLADQRRRSGHRRAMVLGKVEPHEEILRVGAQRFAIGLGQQRRLQRVLVDRVEHLVQAVGLGREKGRRPVRCERGGVDPGAHDVEPEEDDLVGEVEIGEPGLSALVDVDVQAVHVARGEDAAQRLRMALAEDGEDGVDEIARALVAEQHDEAQRSSSAWRAMSSSLAAEPRAHRAPRTASRRGRRLVGVDHAVGEQVGERASGDDGLDEVEMGVVFAPPEQRWNAEGVGARELRVAADDAVARRVVRPRQPLDARHRGGAAVREQPQAGLDVRAAHARDVREQLERVHLGPGEAQGGRQQLAHHGRHIALVFRVARRRRARRRGPVVAVARRMARQRQCAAPAVGATTTMSCPMPPAGRPCAQ